MKFQKLIPSLLIAGAIMTTIPSCGPKDADIKTKVESAVATTPGVSVSVNDGVVTLNGTVSSEQDKANAESAVKNLNQKGVKNVVNNIIVDAPVTTTIATAPTDALTQGVIDATKDFPTVTTRVEDGVIYVTGEVSKDRVQTLKMSLDQLNPKKVDMTGLTVK